MSRRTIISIIVAFLVSGVLCHSWAQGSGDARTRKARLEREIVLLDRRIKENKTRNSDALARLELIRGRMSARKELLDSSDVEIARAGEAIALKQQQIDALQARLDTTMLYYKKLVRSAYKNRDARIWYMYILASDNIQQGLKRMSFFKNLSKRMSEQAGRIKEQKASLEKERALLEKMYAEAKALKAERQKEYDKLKSEEKDMQALTATLKRQRGKYQKELMAKRKQSQELERQIRSAINGAIGGGKNASRKPSRPVDYKLADQFVANCGKLPWPVEGAVVARFGKQYHSVFKSLQLPSNNGVTLAAEPDQTVSAVFNGVVAQITVLPGYHQCILIQHGNYFTLYSKMKSVKVKAGEKVTTGQALGTVDTINGETLFHFEIWDDCTVPQDPENWLRPR